MKNVFITGSGRSGTSMLAGMFANAGYFLGDRLYPPREANPKGFFEDEQINSLNEEIIVYSITNILGEAESSKRLARYRKGNFWLGRFPIEHDFLCNPEQFLTIKGLTAHQPFCFKDPRFCFTVENWTRVVPDSLVLCIFREPAATVESILKECRTANYLFDFSMSVKEAFATWREMYWRILRLYRRHRNVRFVSYEDILSGSQVECLEKLVEAELDRSFPEVTLNRSRPGFEVDELSLRVFEVLMNLWKDDLGEDRSRSRLSLVREIDESLCRNERAIAARGGDDSCGDAMVVSPVWQNRAEDFDEARAESVRTDRETFTEDGAQLEVLRRKVEALQGELRDTLQQNREYIGSLWTTIANQEEEIAALKSEVSRRHGEIVELRSDLARREKEMAALKTENARRDEEVSALYASTCWRITWPIRAVKHLWLATSFLIAQLWQRRSIFRAVFPSGHEERYQIFRMAYRTLPLPAGLKRRVADNVLWRFPALRDRVFGAVVAEGLTVKGPDLRRFVVGVHEGQLRILIVDHRIPTTDRTGSSVRLLAMIKILRNMGFGVTMISDAEKDEYHWILENLDEIKPYEEELRRLGIPFFYGYQAALEHLHAEGHSYRYVLLAFPEIGHRYLPAARAYAVNAKVLYDSVDFHGLRMAREAELAKDESLRKKAEYFQTIEMLNCRCSDLTIAISKDEKHHILRHWPDVHVEVIPNIHDGFPDPHPLSARNGLVFIGHYLHAPNEDAMVYFVGDLLPLIEERLPNIELTILGSSMTARIQALASARVHPVGYVHDPTPYFQEARVFVAPLRFGAGMKGKIGHSMSLGLPVVTTTIGAEGLGLVNGENALVVDEPQDFTKAVIELCENDVLWQRLSTNGRIHIQENFSEAAVGNALRGIFLAST